MNRPPAVSTRHMNDDVHESRPSGETPEPERAPAIATDLTGDLPCIGCGYNLNGLSIRDVCPECGIAVRATILAMVDPMAEELRPIRRPRLVAYGMIVWAWAAIAAALGVWADRLADVVGIWLDRPVALALPERVSLAGIALSGLAAAVFVCPFRRPKAWDTVKAAGGVLLYIPLLFVHYKLHVEYDANPNTGIPFIGPEGIDDGRSMFRLAENLIIVLIVLGLRDHAVSLAERSLVMRTGRVDTQPMIALVASLGLASLGDGLHLAFGGMNGIAADLLYTFELIVIAVGSFLFTLGLIGIGADVVRLRPVLLKPAPGLTDVFAAGERRGDAAE
jgi:hypothetical protein